MIDLDAVDVFAFDLDDFLADITKMRNVSYTVFAPHFEETVERNYGVLKDHALDWPFVADFRNFYRTFFSTDLRVYRKIMPKFLNTLVGEYFDLMLSQPVSFMPGAYELVEQCRIHGICTALLTNGIRQIQDHKLSQLELVDLEPTVYSGDYSFLFVRDDTVQVYHPGKPHPVIYDIMSNKSSRYIESSPNNMVFGDNRLENVLAAVQRGLQGVWLNNKGKAYARMHNFEHEKMIALDTLA